MSKQKEQGISFLSLFYFYDTGFNVSPDWVQESGTQAISPVWVRMTLTAACKSLHKQEAGISSQEVGPVKQEHPNKSLKG